VRGCSRGVRLFCSDEAAWPASSPAICVGADGDVREPKLAAILASDVVGFSRLAGADEDRTLARLRALRRDLIDLPSPCITDVS
jgi:class 3 adenylate cyclase